MIAIVLHDIQRKAGSLNRGSLPLGFLLALIGSEKERNDLCAGAAIVRPEQAITNAVCDSVLHRPYALSADETSPALAAPRHAITALLSCRFKCPCPLRRQRHFHGNADRAYNYTLLRKVVCQMGALPPLEPPTRKGGMLPLHGAHTAFSCYPALRLYRLSKSQRGIDVVSLSK